MKTLDKLRTEIIQSNTFKILAPLDLLVQAKPDWESKCYEQWRINYKECWDNINEKLGIQEYGELRVRKSSRSPRDGRTDVESFLSEYYLSLDNFSYGIAREVAEILYEGFSELKQLPINSRSYECRSGGFGSSGGGLDINLGGRKSHFVHIKNGFSEDSSVVHLESLVMENLKLITPQLTPEDIGTETLVGGPWAELTDKARTYYNKLTKENLFKYLLSY